MEKAFQNVIIDLPCVYIRDGNPVHPLDDALIQYVLNKKLRFFWQKPTVFTYRVEKFTCDTVSVYDDSDLVYFKNDNKFLRWTFYCAYPKEGEDYYLLFVGNSSKPYLCLACKEWELCL